jgi:hypothetical protein
MSVTDQAQLAEALRAHLLSCPGFPVPGRDFGIDAFSLEGDTMTLHMEAGRTIRTYVDGTRIIRQPFGLFFLSTPTESTGERSRMLGVLNKIGEWMASAGPPDIRPKFKATAFEQVSMASLFVQDDKQLGYTATYVLEYETSFQPASRPSAA